MRPGRILLYRSSLLLARRGGPFHQPGYGTWKTRLKLPNNWMAWQAFWLWSPATEIDLIDGINFDNSDPTAGLLTNVISSVAREHRFKLWSEQTVSKLLTEDYHVYTVVWTPEQVTFFLGWARATHGAAVGHFDRWPPHATAPGWEVLGDATYHAGLRWLVYKDRAERLHAYYQPLGAAGWQHAWVTPATAPRAS